MGKFQKHIAVGIASVFALASVGCGPGFQSSGKGQFVQSPGAVDVNDHLAKAQLASQEAQKAMADADAALAEIMDANGNIKLSLFSASGVNSKVQEKGLLSPLVDKLNAVFDKLFAKVDLVKAQFAKARALLNDAIAKIEAAGGSSAQIDMIKGQLAKIDGLEAKFSASMHLLAGKLDLATAALDRIVSSATSAIPGIGSIAGVFIDLFLMSDVKNLIASIKAKLLAL